VATNLAEHTNAVPLTAHPGLGTAATNSAGAFVATNDPAITNRVAFNFRTKLTATVDGTNIYVDVIGVLTNTGTNAGQAYDGAAGAYVSNQLATKLNTNGSASDMSGCPSGALPLAGGTMTGLLYYGTNRLYLGADTNAPWVQGLIGTNGIGTNIVFGAGTNTAIFGAPW
jgi:hypothetical protein